jgi:Domain of unknown function (DUF4296)
MKIKFILITALLVFIISCKEETSVKPKPFIEKNVMQKILFDLAILDAIRYQNPNAFVKNQIDAKSYIFKKYKIDSLTFAKNNAYYATDYKAYKAMYDQINDDLLAAKAKTEVLIMLEEKQKATKK